MTGAQVEVPAELAEALARDVAAAAVFARLSPSHRREYAEWIAEAKREETRRRRAERTIATVLEKPSHS